MEKTEETEEIKNVNDDIKIVKITWLDPQSVDLLGICYNEDIKDIKLKTCSIVGHLVQETNDCYIVAKELWENGGFKYIHMIPKKVVEKIEILENNKNNKNNKNNILNILFDKKFDNVLNECNTKYRINKKQYFGKWESFSEETLNSELLEEMERYKNEKAEIAKYDKALDLINISLMYAEKLGRKYFKNSR